MGQLDVRDAAHGHAADLHLVAPDELVGFGEFELVVGAAAAGEHEVGDDQHHQRERADRGSARPTPERAERTRRRPGGSGGGGPGAAAGWGG